MYVQQSFRLICSKPPIKTAFEVLRILDKSERSTGSVLSNISMLVMSIIAVSFLVIEVSGNICTDQYQEFSLNVGYSRHEVASQRTVINDTQIIHDIIEVF